jgi:hypothetical protein
MELLNATKVSFALSYRVIFSGNTNTHRDTRHTPSTVEVLETLLDPFLAMDMDRDLPEMMEGKGMR